MSILTQSQGLLTRARRFAKRAADGLLAQDCLLCGQASGEKILCPACAGDLPRLPVLRCPSCALPTASGETCGRCLAHPPHYDRTFAVFDYAFPLDKLIQSFKYGHRLALAACLGQELTRLAQESRLESTVDLVVPLPLHPARLRERGFNQALELARPVAGTLGLPLDFRVCARIRQTPAQAGLPWKQREKNVRGAFHCARDLSGQRILLVDDVMTTGASLDECARTLKRRGAAEVTLLVVARTLP
ncbi:MAG: ComF family protein [Candidatus Accumulibacter sp.]|jgi:ComF family protein|nr:ComF family protein [Accumulibacter sp.]